MVFRATVIALLGSLVLLHFGHELRSEHTMHHLASHVAASAQASPASSPVVIHQMSPSANLPAGTSIVDAWRAEIRRLVDRGPAARSGAVTRRGDLAGIELLDVPANSALAAVGLRDGDVVLTVNDRPAYRIGDAEAIARFIARHSFTDFTVRRQGARKRVVVLLHE